MADALQTNGKEALLPQNQWSHGEKKRIFDSLQELFYLKADGRYANQSDWAYYLKSG